MRLQEKDWDAPGGVRMVDYDYPDAPIKAFLDWMRNNNAWQDNPELFIRRVRQLNGVLMDLRNSGQARPVEVEGTVTASAFVPAVLVGAEMTRTAVAGTSVAETPDQKQARIQAQRAANLAKARAARRKPDA